MDITLYEDERCKMKLEAIPSKNNTVLAVLGCYIDNSPEGFAANAALSQYLLEKPHLYKLPKGVQVSLFELFDNLSDAISLMLLEKIVPTTENFRHEVSGLLEAYHLLLEKAQSQRDRAHGNDVYSKLYQIIENYKGIFPKIDQNIATFRTKLRLSLDDL